MLAKVFNITKMNVCNRNQNLIFIQH